MFEDHENVYILLEVCTNQTLNELIKRRKRLTEIEVQYYLAQIVSSLIYLHQNKVIHREYCIPYTALNLATFSSMKTWRLSLEISDLLLAYNTMNKKRKLSAEHQIISLLKFLKAKVILMKLTSGLLVSLCIFLPM